VNGLTGNGPLADNNHFELISRVVVLAGATLPSQIDFASRINKVNRRRFLGQTALAPLLAGRASARSLADQKTARPPKEAARIGAAWQLFLDHEGVAIETGLTRVLHRPKRRGWVIPTEHPWETDIRMLLNPVLRDDAGRFHAFYQVMWVDPSAHATDKAHWFSFANAYAFSDDGIHWTKPKLGLMDIPARSGLFPRPLAGGKTRDHNAGVAIRSVVDFKTFGNVDDPSRRYLVSAIPPGNSSTGSSVNDIGARESAKYQSYFSQQFPDFINDAKWRERLTPCEPDVWKCPRATFTGPVGQDETGAWFGFSQGVRPNWIPSRDIARWSVGKDGVWHAHSVLYPDAYDSHTREDYEEFMEFSTVWTGDAWLGFIAVFHSDRSSESFRAPKIPAYRKGTTDLQLVLSRDHGRSWVRVGNRQTWLVHGDEENDFDRLAYRGLPLRVKDETWFYYNAMDGDHLGFRNDESQSTYYHERFRKGGIALATLRHNGYLSLRAGIHPETLVTKPFVYQGNRLVVNADCGAGNIQAELVPAAPQPIVNLLGDAPVPECSFKLCVPLKGVGVEQKVQWSGDPNLRAWAGKPVRLRFRIENADLYGFRFEDAS